MDLFWERNHKSEIRSTGGVSKLIQMGKQKNSQTPRTKRESDGRLKFLTDCCPLAIPVGSRFQADVPRWIDDDGMPLNHRQSCAEDEDGDTSRWLRTRSWPIDGSSSTSSTIDDEIGKGRADSCSCPSPGSETCAKLHIQEKIAELQQALGAAFKDWHFDTMGEEAASKSWTPKEQKRFEALVKGNPPSKQKSFLKPAMEAFPSKSRAEIVNYYCNVFVPRRIGRLTRAGCRIIDSDDDEPSKTICYKSPRKRSQADSTSPDSRQIKTPFLRGHR